MHGISCSINSVFRRSPMIPAAVLNGYRASRWVEWTSEPDCRFENGSSAPRGPDGGASPAYLDAVMAQGCLTRSSEELAALCLGGWVCGEGTGGIVGVNTDRRRWVRRDRLAVGHWLQSLSGQYVARNQPRASRLGTVSSPSGLY